MSDVIDGEFQDVKDEDKLALAISALRSTPYWSVILDSMKDRRESWIVDSRLSNVYQNHAELVHVTARIAELDHLIQTFT